MLKDWVENMTVGLTNMAPSGGWVQNMTDRRTDEHGKK